MVLGAKAHADFLLMWARFFKLNSQESRNKNQDGLL